MIAMFLLLFVLIIFKLFSAFSLNALIKVFLIFTAFAVVYHLLGGPLNAQILLLDGFLCFLGAFIWFCFFLGQ